ncbi:MAG: DUF4861 domain-containing protein [Prevotellaceae bacterium]|jgi:hypothetical protein|nr:DUF4861 domain-containing protein [Prevotellaceae bacterium]
MKKILLIFLTVLLFASCKKSVEITVVNRLNLDRNNEMVQFCLCSVEQKLGLTEDKKIIILNADNKQVPYQILSDGKMVIFPAQVAANDSAIYRVMVGEPDSFTVKTFARQVPERKDDFAWENDRIAFRMYGPALAPENPSNGVDIWLKRTEELIVNKFYKDDLEKGIHYHVDNGQGIDCYKVAHTLGAGGVAPYTDSTLWVGGYYNSCKVLESGALRTKFVLNYDSLTIGFTPDMAKNTKCMLPKTPYHKIKASLTITLDAGSQLNRAEVVYEGNNVDKMPVAAGFYLHQFGNSNGKDVPVTEQQTATDQEKGYIALAEDAVSDALVPSGRNYLGVVIPSGISQIKVDKGIACAAPSDEHLIAVSDYHAGSPFVYYFGGAWSKWGFANDQDWFDYMEQTAQKLRSPLEVKVQKQ